MKYRKTSVDCEKFAIWHYRLNIAFWVFIIFSFGSMLTGQPASLALIYFILTSIAFWGDYWLFIHHRRQHIKEDKEF